MAKTCMIERERKREKLINKFMQKRKELKHARKLATSYEELIAAQSALSSLPVNSSRIRYQRRCQQCGRPHAVYRKFALCRLCLRIELMSGNVTGGRKSSW